MILDQSGGTIPITNLKCIDIRLFFHFLFLQAFCTKYQGSTKCKNQDILNKCIRKASISCFYNWSSIFSNGGPDIYNLQGISE